MTTFRNKGGKSRVTVASGRVVVVGAGKSVKTDNEELKTALRKSGFAESSSSSSSEKTETKKEKD